MKRSSSSSAKENALRGSFNKLSATKHLNSQLTPSQPLQDPPQSPTLNPYLEQFYKTFGSNNYVEWSRPESKQACRKYCGRPETSKGIRPLEKVSKKWLGETKDGNYHSQYVPEKMAEECRQENNSHIEIIVTKSRKKAQINEKVRRSKFETDLDDEFLQLFAN